MKIASARWKAPIQPAPARRSADNPRNPSTPPVRVTWGEESKDEMGSISLIAVPHEQTDHATLQGDLDRRRRELAISRMRADPALADRVKQLLSE